MLIQTFNKTCLSKLEFLKSEIVVNLGEIDLHPAQKLIPFQIFRGVHTQQGVLIFKVKTLVLKSYKKYFPLNLEISNFLP